MTALHTFTLLECLKPPSKDGHMLCFVDTYTPSFNIKINKYLKNTGFTKVRYMYICNE